MTGSAAGRVEGSTAPRRALTVLDCIGIGINGVIGSGIFLLPAGVFAAAGGRAPLAWLIVGGLCLLVGLCFAEAASYTDRSGGPYAYARMAFGREVGFGVGFIALASMVLSYATVVRGLTVNLATFVPSVQGHEVAVGAAIIGALAAANIAGIKPAAWTSNFFSAAKLVPLCLLVVLGLWAMDSTWTSRFAAPPTVMPDKAGLLPAAMLALFACTGFEFVSVPAGETRDPARAVPVALLGTLAGSIGLYVVVQVVAIATTPATVLAGADRALVTVASHVGGAWLARLLALGAVISAFGFCAGSALIGPSYIAAFAADDMLPPVLGARRSNGSPVVAIVAYGLASALLGNLGDFKKLADISNIAVVAQYLPTCAALLVLRRIRPPARFRLPLGPLIPLAAIAGCAVFLSAVQREEAQVCAMVVATGFALRLAHLGWRRLSPR